MAGTFDDTDFNSDAFSSQKLSRVSYQTMHICWAAATRNVPQRSPLWVEDRSSVNTQGRKRMVIWVHLQILSEKLRWKSESWWIKPFQSPYKGGSEGHKEKLRSWKGFLKRGWTQEFIEASSQPEKTGPSSPWRGFHTTCRKYSPRGESTWGYSAALLLNRVHSCCYCCFKGMPIHIS